MTVLIDQLVRDPNSAVMRAVAPDYAAWRPDTWILAQILDNYVTVHRDPDQPAPAPYPRPGDAERHAAAQEAEEQRLERQRERQRERERERQRLREDGG